MKLKIICWNVRGMNDKEKRRIIDLLIRKWNTDIMCLTKTKMNKIDLPCIKQVGGSRWIDWVELEARGSSGGILVYWDKRRWQYTYKEVGHHSITIILEGVSLGLQYVNTSHRYMGHVIEKKKKLWKELIDVHETITQLWAIAGDFNVIRKKKFMKRADRCTRSYNPTMGNRG